jgi:hypothetical protein
MRRPRKAMTETHFSRKGESKKWRVSNSSSQAPISSRAPQSDPTKEWALRRRFMVSNHSSLAVIGTSCGQSLFSRLPPNRETHALVDTAKSGDVSDQTSNPNHAIHCVLHQWPFRKPALALIGGMPAWDQTYSSAQLILSTCNRISILTEPFGKREVEKVHRTGEDRSTVSNSMRLAHV